MVWNFVLYLLYGLAFFTLGVAILSRDTRLSELGIARIIWLLAFFGIIHGFHEWSELLEQLNPTVNSPAFSFLRLVIVTSSFLCLLYFGIFLNLISIYGDKALQTIPKLIKGVIGILAFTLVLLAVLMDYNTGSDITVRRLVAFPGGLLSGIGLILYSRAVRMFSKKVAMNFILAGIFMVLYAVSSGVIPSSYVIPFFEAKIIMLRGASAFCIMFFTIKALSVFSIEQRKLTDEHLQRFAQSEKLTSMGILAAGIAHEINNPLTNASLNLEMLKDLVSGNEKIDKKLQSIDRNIERASTIAQELLHFSREKVTSFEPVNVSEIIANSYNLVKNQPLSSIIDLQLTPTPDIRGMPYKLEEVFINLFMNSFDACTKEDYILVTTSVDSQRVKVEITDSGHGIAKEHITNVFDPFFTTKEIGKGTGLGLSVCYNILKQHQGDISIVSSENGGAVVTITFPLADNHE